MRKAVPTLTAAVMTLVLAGVASAVPIIDGDLDAEWSSHLLGTSETLHDGSVWMSVEVYGMVEGDTLYVAYRADEDQPGWGTELPPGDPDGGALNFWGVSNLYFTAQESGIDGGSTFIGHHEGVAQSTTSGWVYYDGYGDRTGDMSAIGISSYWSTPSTDPDNIIELSIPLAFLSYAGPADRIGLWGQYWHGASSEVLYVGLPPDPVPEPASMVMLVGGCIGIAGARKMRRRKSDRT